MTDTSPEPLHRYPRARTSNPDELRAMAPQWLGATRVDLRHTGQLDARLNLIELDTTGLAFGYATCDLFADHHPADFVRLQIALKGRSLTCVGDRRSDLNAEQLTVTSADVPWQMLCQAGHARLTLRLQQQALMRKLAMLTGVTPKAGYGFDQAIAAGDPQARSLRRLVDFLSQQLSETAAALPRAVYHELEDAVQIAFLHASRHPLRELLEGACAPPDSNLVRRIEAFIEANWREPLTIERLAGEAEVSARALFRAFERLRGNSPMAFVKAVRLRRAREMLQTGDPALTVTAAAAACNFSNASHFARYYREAYGELPSMTAARAASRSL